MITLRAIFTAFAPEYLERNPHLPLSHRKVISAIQHCQSGHYGHSSDIHVMLALRRSPGQVIVTNKQLNGADMVGELLRE